MLDLSQRQISDLQELKVLCDEIAADLVVIGAIAYQFHFPNELRHTADIDFAVALNLDEFAQLEQALLTRQWTRLPNLEHRWRSHYGTLLDLVPAGPKLRAAGEITWPESGFRMSLAGFEHVFVLAELHEVTAGLRLKVIPPVVLALLKIVAYVENPVRRAKDLDDIRGLLSRYEEQTDRLFSDAVLDADLSDIDLAPAYLLGVDLARMCTDEETRIIYRFLEVIEETRPGWPAFVRARRTVLDADAHARAQRDAFTAGFSSS